MTKKYRIKLLAKNYWTVIHPDGFWVGPGLGQFYSVADAIDWLYSQRRA